jgi:dimethylhistidine N-methyltransferase
MKQFLQDVVKGLSAPQKYLESKYFYDATGDELFRKIMGCPDYYLTRCESEIFQQQTGALASTFVNGSQFDVVELGAGDASKSSFLLQAMLNVSAQFTYYPVDISKDVIEYLQHALPASMPALKVHGLNGEYFSMLEKMREFSSRKKVVLFLGSNIGNVPLDQTQAFLTRLRSSLSTGDMVLIGFDLQKDPQTVLNAYNDSTGYTRQFNLNLLQRINRELSGNFNIDHFKHFPVYDPGSGTCKSYLVSTEEQQVEVADHQFSCKKYEPIYMEVSQKYTVEQTDAFARGSGFVLVKHFFDSKHWFCDAVWRCEG